MTRSGGLSASCTCTSFQHTVLIVDDIRDGPSTPEIFSSSSSWVSTPTQRIRRPSGMQERQDATAPCPSATLTPFRRALVREATTVSGNLARKKYRKRTSGARPKVHPAAGSKRGRSLAARGTPPNKHRPEGHGRTGQVMSHGLRQLSTPTRSLTVAHSASTGTPPPLPMTRHTLPCLQLTWAVVPSRVARVPLVHTQVGTSLTPTKASGAAKQAGGACDRAVPAGAARMLQNILTPNARRGGDQCLPGPPPLPLPTQP